MSALALHTRAVLREAAPAAAPLEGAFAEWTAVASCPTDLLVGGEWRPARAGRTLRVDDPSTGEALCSVADASRTDAMEALAAASGAAAEWAAGPPATGPACCAAPRTRWRPTPSGWRC